MEFTPRNLVERFYRDVWNGRDVSVAGKIVAGDFRFRGSLGPEMVGRSAFMDYLHAIHATLDDYHCKIEELHIEGERAAARMTFSGIHKAPLFGVAATGRHVSWGGAAFFHVQDARIRELWVLGDVDDLRRQLGLETRPPF